MSRSRVNRRTFVAASSAVGVAAEAGGLSRVASGQTVNTEGATPGPVGSPVPPELTASQTDWAVEGGNLGMTREALGSSIQASSVPQLDVGWKTEIKVNSAYGSMSANPIVIGNMLHMQDMTSNV